MLKTQNQNDEDVFSHTSQLFRMCWFWRCCPQDFGAAWWVRSLKNRSFFQRRIKKLIRGKWCNSQTLPESCYHWRKSQRCFAFCTNVSRVVFLNVLEVLQTYVSRKLVVVCKFCRPIGPTTRFKGCQKDQAPGAFAQELVMSMLFRASVQSATDMDSSACLLYDAFWYVLIAHEMSYYIICFLMFHVFENFPGEMLLRSHFFLKCWSRWTGPMLRPWYMIMIYIKMLM